MWRGIGAGPAVSFDCKHGPLGPHSVRQRDGEEAGARVEIGEGCPFAVADHIQDGREQGLGRASVRLPEHAGRDPVGVAARFRVHCDGVASHLPLHDKAGVDARHRRSCRGRAGLTETTASSGTVPVTTSSSAVPGHGCSRAPVAPTSGLATGHASTRSTDGSGAGGIPAWPSRSTATAYPTPPPEPAVVAFDRSDHDLRARRRRSAQQFGDARSLEPRCASELHVLEITAPAASRPGVGTGRIDPVGRGAEHSRRHLPASRSSSLEVTRARTRSPGRRVADEDHLAVGSPGYAAAAAAAIAPTWSSKSSSRPWSPSGSKRTAAELGQDFLCRGVVSGPARSS